MSPRAAVCGARRPTQAQAAAAGTGLVELAPRVASQLSVNQLSLVRMVAFTV